MEWKWRRRSLGEQTYIFSQKYNEKNMTSLY